MVVKSASNDQCGSVSSRLSVRTLGSFDPPPRPTTRHQPANQNQRRTERRARFGSYSAFGLNPQRHGFTPLPRWLSVCRYAASLRSAANDTDTQSNLENQPSWGSGWSFGINLHDDMVCKSNLLQKTENCVIVSIKNP